MHPPLTRLALMLALLALATLSCTRAPPAEWILLDGRILTVDPWFSIDQALAIGDGKILAVGTNAEGLRLAGPDTRHTDLKGKTVIPGLADNHLHTAGGGSGVDLSRVRSQAELLSAIAERARQADPGELVVTNSDWHEGQLEEQRLPLRDDLDPVSPRNPVVVIRGGHEYILNSRGLEKWSLGPDTPVPEGGRISRYADGRLNGELVDTARNLVQLPVPPAPDLETAIQHQREEYRKLHAVGLTSIRHPGGTPAQYRLLQVMRRRKLLSIRVQYLLRMRHVRTAAAVEALLAEWRVQPGERDEWLRPAGIKLGVDGGFEGGLMSRPYAEPWGRKGTFFGLRTMPQAAYDEVVGELHRRGWRVSTHAVGDAAIDQVLEGYEKAHQQASILGLRWTIEHGFLPRPDHFPRIRNLGLLVSSQNHLYLAGPSLQKYWGRERAERATPVRDYRKHGVALSAGNDSPVVPYPPLWVFYHLVTRDTISGGVYGDDQRVSRREALQLLTIRNAYLGFEKATRGSLESGKLADFVVLSGNILEVPDQQIREIQVLMTVVGWKVVHETG